MRVFQKGKTMQRIFALKNLGKAVTAALATVMIFSGLSACGSSESSSDSHNSLNLINDGKLTACVSLISPPYSYKDNSGNPTGTEVDLIKAIAKQMNLEPEYRNYDFSGLIPALQANQCDVIMSSLYIKPEREKVVDFVPYLKSASSVVVSKSNPKKITGFDDSLCGNKLASVTGSTGATYLEKIAKQCATDGKTKPTTSLVSDSANALLMVKSGQLDALVTTAEEGGFDTKKTNGAVQVAGKVFDSITIGAATTKQKTALHEELAKALKAVKDSGEYSKILDKWGSENMSV